MVKRINFMIWVCYHNRKTFWKEKTQNLLYFPTTLNNDISCELYMKCSNSFIYRAITHLYHKVIFVITQGVTKSLSKSLSIQIVS